MKKRRDKCSNLQKSRSNRKQNFDNKKRKINKCWPNSSKWNPKCNNFRSNSESKMKRIKEKDSNYKERLYKEQKLKERKSKDNFKDSNRKGKEFKERLKCRGKDYKIKQGYNNKDYRSSLRLKGRK